MSKRKGVATNFGNNYYFLVKNNLRSYEEPITSLDAPYYKEAINNEIDFIISNHT